MSVSAIVDANLAAYGANDLAALAETLSPTCVMGGYGGQAAAIGRAACVEAYARTIDAYPMGSTRALNRIVFGAAVVDHEASRRAKDGALAFVATMYSIADGLIARIDTVRSKAQATATQCAQAQLDFYNAQDIDAYMACFAPDATIGDYQRALTQNNATEIRARYESLFQTHPHNHAALLNRIAVGDVAFDHERVTRNPGGDSFEALAIYRVQDGLIRQVEFVR
jgi:hypothetical protein